MSEPNVTPRRYFARIPFGSASVASPVQECLAQLAVMSGRLDHAGPLEKRSAVARAPRSEPLSPFALQRDHCIPVNTQTVSHCKNRYGVRDPTMGLAHFARHGSIDNEGRVKSGTYWGIERLARGTHRLSVQCTDLNCAAAIPGNTTPAWGRP